MQLKQHIQERKKGCVASASPKSAAKAAHPRKKKKDVWLQPHQKVQIKQHIQERKKGCVASASPKSADKAAHPE